MPVVQKTGPDGCLYVLDWYDRYHCYQDANRDPKGIDRLKGRLYRIRYQDTPRAASFDLTKENDDELVGRLASKNVFYRDHAQRLLAERADSGTRRKLQDLVLDDKAPRKARMHALWSVVSMGPLDAAFHQALFAHGEPSYRAWAVRAAGNQGKIDDAIRSLVQKAADDESPDVKLQVAIGARKIEGIDAMPLLLKVLATCGEDKLIPQIVLQNLHPLLENGGGDFLKLVKEYDLKKTPNLSKIMPRATERMLAKKKP
jgi:hypothetical protein